MTNSTFVANSANAPDGSGGAIDNASTLNVINSTFSKNSANSGGAIADGTTTIKGSILAASTGGGNCAATITNDGYNISDDASCGFGTSTAANGLTIGDNVNPLLDPAGLASNGGPTQTIALQSNSAAVDAIPFASCTFTSGTLNPCTNPPALTTSNQLICDQRGEPRPDPEDGPNGACDIGAFELQQSISFARFRPLLIVDLPQYFTLQGSLALAPGRPALDPSTEAVVVTLSSESLAPVTLTIPPGSFRRFDGQYVFRGKVRNVTVFALITPLFRNDYGFLIAANGLSLTGISNPVTVTLEAGLDSGTQNVRAVFIGGRFSGS